jgi:hypothetical protein
MPNTHKKNNREEEILEAITEKVAMGTYMGEWFYKTELSAEKLAKFLARPTKSKK